MVSSRAQVQYLQLASAAAAIAAVPVAALIRGTSPDDFRIVSHGIEQHSLKGLAEFLSRHPVGSQPSPLSRAERGDAFFDLPGTFHNALIVSAPDPIEPTLLVLLGSDPIEVSATVIATLQLLTAQVSVISDGQEQLNRATDQLQHTGAALWHAEEKYIQLVNNLDVGILQLRPDGGLLSANAAAARLFAFTSIADLYRAWNRSTNGFYVVERRKLEFFQLLQNHNTLFHFESEVWNQMGNKLWVSETCRPIRDLNGALLFHLNTVEDITETRRTAESLRLSESLYESLVANLPQAIYRKDRQGRFTFASPNYCQSISCSPVAILGRLETDLPEIDPGHGSHERDLEVMTTGKPVEGVDSIKRSNGEVVHIKYIKLPLGGMGNEVAGMQSISWDITDHKAAELELARARDAAITLARTKTAFLANMSHELRTPLNGIIGMASLLGTTPLSEDQKDILSTVETSAENLLGIISEVLDYSKLEAGKMQLEPGPLDVNQLLESVLDLFAERAQSKRIELAARFLPCASEPMIGDAGKIRQVLVNLVGNALKFTDSGSVCISVEAMQPKDGGILLRFGVADTGIGIGPDIQANLFTPFTQGDISTTRQFGGTGLGLAISRQFVELMNGQIGLKSEPGKGSEFWFTIRATVDTGCTIDQQPHSAERHHSVAEVLLMMERCPTADTLSILLSERGCNVHLEAHQNEATNWIRRHSGDDQAAAIFVDMDLWNGTGLDLLLRMNAQEKLPLPPTILLCTRGQMLDPLAAEEAGLAGCLPKPVKPSRLQACLNEIADLPLRRTRRLTRLNAGDTAFHRRRHGLGSQRVLLVDDNSVNQKLALILLDRLGYCADPVANGLEAVEALKRAHYPVVLMDCRTPVMDGWEATRLIRRLESQQFWGEDSGHSYIIGLLSQPNDADFETCHSAGMNDCLTKPLHKDELMPAMAQAVGRLRNGDSKPITQPVRESSSSRAARISEITT